MMSAILIAYMFPETTLPMASVVAASVGFVLTFGRVAWKFVKGAKPSVAEHRGKGG